jgi:hypothetical protein
MTTGGRIALLFFVLGAAGSAWVVGNGTAGWVYVLIYGMAVLPGLRVGFALFGRAHAGGWIAGVLIGYVLAAVAVWAVIAAHVASAPGFLVAWAFVAVIVWLILSPIRSPLVPLPAWTPAATTSLLLVLVLTLAIAVPPWANVGRADSSGNRYYRAYFTADFVWHMALTAEIAKFSMPPRNPYLSPKPIHYYWTYFLVPAAITATGPPGLRDVERCLKLNAIVTGLLLMSALFLAAWTAIPRAGPAGIAVALALVASSAEGIAAIAGLWWTGRPFSELRNINIDAVSNWALGSYRIDGLQRCLWYVPQHSMGYALGLIALAAAAAAGSRATNAAITLVGVALGSSVACNPLVGGIFAMAYGAAVIIDALGRPAPVPAILRHAIAAVPVAAAIAWCVTNQMVEGAGAALEFGFSGQSRHHPLLALMVSLGPVLMLAAAGLWPDRRIPLRALLPYAILAALSLALLYLVRLSVDLSWVGFRAGHLILVALPPLGARFIAVFWDRGRHMLAAAAIVLVLVAGAPTVVIDEYNAWDIHNLVVSPGGFPWTIVVSPEQQAAFHWIREHTAPDDIVQMDPIERGRATWSLIPTFAERRMAAGLPISLMSTAEYDERSAHIHAMYAATDPAEASRIASALRLDYIYADEVERSAHAATTKFDSSPQYFEPVFRNGTVGVYRVR